MVKVETLKEDGFVRIISDVAYRFGEIDRYFLDMEVKAWWLN